MIFPLNLIIRNISAEETSAVIYMKVYYQSEVNSMSFDTRPVNKIPWMLMSDLSTPNSISWSPLSQSESCFLMKKSSYSE